MTQSERPEGLSPVPTYRFWGSQKPPKNRAEIFSMSTAPAATPEGGPDATEAVSTATVATLRMYGPIDSWGGFWGISANDVSEALDSLPDTVDQIVLRVNSPGGEVWEGLAILNMLRAHNATVTAVVDGIAASAASFVAAGCDTTVMSPGSQMMIHDARTFVYGTPAGLRKTAEILDTLSNSSADLYAEAAGGTSASWRALQVEETWYTAKEAVAAGLADRVGVVKDAGPAVTAGDDDDEGDLTEGDGLDDDSTVEQRFDLSIYKHPGRSHAPAPAAALSAAHNPPSASAVGSTPTQEREPIVRFSDETVTTMRQKLGIAEDADEATILAALDEVLAEQIEPPAPTQTAELTPPPGQRLIPEAAYEELQANARAGAAAAEQLRIQQREQFLDAHQDRFIPANRAAWQQQYDVNPEGTRQYLAEAAVVVPIAEVGHDVNPEAKTEDDAWFPGYTTPITQEA